MRLATTTLLAVLNAAALARGGEAAPAAPSFTAKPTATKAADGKVKIDFAVSRETDVTVCIEDANGRPVRHLVSGVLGKNPPPPLKPGLAQSIEWDGKADWGKPAPAGAFKVRVMLGLGAKYDKEVVAEPLSIGAIQTIAAGPDGTLYAVVGAGSSVPNWPSQRVVAINRDGTFGRTLVPPPANATKEQLQAMGGVPVEVGGRTVPMVLHVNQRRHTTFQMRGHAGQTAVTPGGGLLFVHGGEFIGMLDVASSKAPPPLAAPKPLPSVPAASFRTLNPYEPEKSYICASADGKFAYFSGLARQATPYGDKNKIVPPYPAVFRVKLPERTPAEPFFGDLEKAGNDETHLGGLPRGMAVDGKGHLLICDTANNRVVVVSEADGKFAGAFPAEGAEGVAVNRESGEVYLLKPGKDVGAELVKLSGWKDPKQLASTTVTSPVWPKRRVNWQMAADVSGKPPVFWLAGEGSPLLRIEDQGAKFSDAAKITGKQDIGDAGFVGISVDHFREDPEVYARISGAGYRIGFVRYNEKADKVEPVVINTSTTASGSLIEAGPDGNLYVQGWPEQLYKCDRNGRPLKWEVPYTPKDEKAAKVWPGNAIFSRVIMVYMTHTLGIRGDGQLFIFDGHPTEGKNGTHALFEYSPSGAGGPGPGKHPIVWGASDSVVGPRFDQQGNIYVAEQIRPVDELVPPEFAAVTGPVKIGTGWRGDDPRAAIGTMYGSIVKFGPKGGRFDFQFYKARADEPKPDPAWKTVEAASWICQIHDSFSPNKVTGALWMHMGVSHVSLHNCNCENTRFDVDPYGRVWYPDLGRYRVGVLDTNGNPVTAFGGYGNAESRGPESKDKALAEPDIAFSWLIGVGATDRAAYMGDSLNRRLLKARLVYAAEEACDVK
ncbi:MAG TPA: hypothetical protein PK280_09905 [Planctomycetota bacterium]|nr:hypothetical protein [Planctomycetota bacterium]